MKTRRICGGFESSRDAVSRLERADRCGRVGRGCLTGSVSERIEAGLAFDHDALRGRGSHPESVRSGFAAPVTVTWLRLRERLVLVDDVLTIDKPAVFPVNKDRPILFSALATADVLLTLDRADFGRLLGTRFYGLAIMTPGTWLTQEREPGRSGAS